MLGLLVKILPLALNLIPMVERLFGAGEGSKKRSLIVALIIPVVQAYESVKGKELVDEVALADAVGAIVDGVVGIANLFGLFDGNDDVA